MSMDAGGLAHMNYNGFPSNGLGAPGSGYAARGGNRANNVKRLSVALPSKVNPINESQVDNPTPRTSRSHLLAGLRTQPKTPGGSASAPYNQNQHQAQHQSQGMAASKWAEQNYNAYAQGMPQSVADAGFNPANQYAVNAGRQMYSLPEQVLAPPNVYGQEEEMDPSVLEQLQMTGLFLAQRQQQLQQQLANITAAANQFGGMSLNQNAQHQQQQYHHAPMTPQTPQNGYYGQQQQMQSPIEVPGQPGVYLVYNPAIQGYTYAVDPNFQEQLHATMSMGQNSMYASSGATSKYDNQTPSFRAEISPPPMDKMSPMNARSFTPPKKTSSPPVSLEPVEPLPPPSATAFRRGHKKASSLAISPLNAVSEGPKTSSMATFGSQRTVFPPTPMTGTFGPGAARAGEHPMRQPRGPPPLEELKAAPTSRHEGSKNFATRQRRIALDSLMRMGTVRRAISRSPAGSPVFEAEYNFSIGEEDEDVASPAPRKMSPIGSEMKEKRASGSSDGYFGLSSGSGSESEEAGAFKQPPTPATPSSTGGDRKKLMLGALTAAAEKRRSCLY